MDKMREDEKESRPCPSSRLSSVERWTDDVNEADQKRGCETGEGRKRSGVLILNFDISVFPEFWNQPLLISLFLDMGSF